MGDPRKPVTLSPVVQDWNTERHSGAGWPQFLESVRIEGLRGWKSTLVEFRFPVVAIAGENGAGKSTVLKAAAAAYGAPKGVRDTLAFYPDDFFPSTPWEKVEGVKLGYQVRRGDVTTSISLSKKTSRWRGMPNRHPRSVFFLDVSRTQPINTLVGYGKIAKELIFPGDEIPFLEEDRALLSRIMNKPYTKSVMATYENKQIGVLTTPEGEYSNFHQGAGEDATADLVALLRSVPKYSLILIDEVEASLHPRAQRRLMTELFAVARANRVQFLLSTHSPYILEQLPAEARVHIQLTRKGERNVIYGVTPEFSMSMMDDVYHPELTLYCEDLESAVLVDALIAHEAPEIRNRLSILPVGAASTVKTLGALSADDKLGTNAMGVLDGEQGASPGCVVIPGKAAPERAVFASMSEDAWEAVSQRLGVRAGDLFEAVDDAVQIENHHAWSRKVAERLGARVRTDRVWEASAAVWADVAVDEAGRKEFVESIKERLGQD
ncbi:ATP-dependent nuclease [Lentzea sp. NEAU-D7]|uniref:ATP-dependent nuclease n=1 Tax=Lentzea sp. NEAU-D7 TaxID=2994667 RepID=UPI00224AD235|nr:AAA family ATPase [Lentzea sp. NEAU-D7]MCX2950749.1 AAA family ATPase [Lentzea sp. NEAU-D7]